MTAVGALLLIVAPGRSADWFGEGLMLAIVGVVLIAVGGVAVVALWRLLAPAELADARTSIRNLRGRRAAG